MSNSKLTVLVSFCAEAGHLNACVGLTLPLVRRGHRVVVVTHVAWQGKLAALGYEECVYGELDHNPSDAIAAKFEKMQVVGPYSTKHKLTNIVRYFRSGGFEQKLEPLNATLAKAIAQYKPNVIVVDDHAVPPAVHYSAIPWVKSISMCPLYEMFHPDLPPGGSGFPTNGDRSEWAEYNAIREGMFVMSDLNDAFERWGYKRYPKDHVFTDSQLLTVYACPDELNHPQIQATGWFNLEAFNKVDASQNGKPLSELVPKDFYASDLDGKFSGKYILVSMGSMGSVDLVLMRRLVSILGETQHKYIVSKGPNHDRYDLTPNMWGEKYISQAAILPHMDLVITHGGNNSVTEAFAQGKKMVVMPLFVDQFDNAQRLHETGLGTRVDPYTVPEQQLRNIIDRMLSDQVLEQKLRQASQRIQTSDAHERLADQIECIATNKA